ncbi:MAG: hypothetical protein R3359_12300 [Marinirhabdus sp.]|nr:hypothetical protein [Marinirhabdus sp.]
MTNYLSSTIDILTIVAIIIGAFWAIHRFITEQNKAGLSIKIDRIENYDFGEGSILVNLNVNVKNIGNRELGLKYRKNGKPCTFIRIFKLNNMQLNDRIISVESNAVEKEVYTMDSRHTSFKDLDNTRIRANVDYNFPYSFIVDEPGRYFIEFCTVSDMNIYKSWFSSVLTRKEGDLTWNEKIFINIPHNNA